MEEVRANYHISVSIIGLENRLNGITPEKYGSWQILEDGNGRFLTKAEVRAEIERCKQLGYKVIPTCEKLTEDGMCAGHKA